ncbi:MAG: pectin acetylesterase-family hydrolase [Sandaracinaceae bacterium]
MRCLARLRTRLGVLLLPALVGCGEPPGLDAGVDAGPPPPREDAGPRTFQDGPPPLPDTPYAPRTLAAAYNPGPPSTTEPLGTPLGEWTWVDQPRTRCLDGSSTGMVVSRGTGEGLIVYMQEGGAAWDRHSLSYGVSRTRFREEDASILRRESSYSWLFDRDDDSNPFRDWSFVFLPYCSGDVFAGNVVDSALGTMHTGAVNVEIALERLVPTFGEVERVLVAGSSAGGFGAALNFHRIQQAFPDAEASLVNDSGPPLPDPYMPVCLQRKWRDTWGLDRTLPAECDACRDPSGGGMANLYAWLAERYPDRRFGTMTHEHDFVIRAFYSGAYIANCSGFTIYPRIYFADGLAELERTLIDPAPNMHLYVSEGADHMFLLRGGSVGERAFVEGIVFGS